MKNPRRGIAANRRFWMVVFVLVSLGVIAGGLAYYWYEQDHIRREKYQELAAIADLKVREILEWRRERLDDARRMARDPFLGKAIAAWLRDPDNPSLRAVLLERFKLEQTVEQNENVLLANLDGRFLLSIRPDPVPLSPAGKQALEAAVAGRQSVLGDLFRSPKDDRVHLDVAAPVLDPRGQPLAVVVLRVNADRVLYPLIQSWPTPSLTAETLLVEVEGKDVLFLNELRHREKTALSLREPLTQKDLPAVQAGLGKQGVFEGRDYRGKKVLADLRAVPQSPWFMVAKEDADEILAEARYRAGITALFVVIFILLTAAVTAYGYRQRQANLYQDLYRTEREQRQAQEEFRTTLYSIGDAVITTDTAGLVKQMNPVAERLTGWPEAEARGKPLEEVFRIINEETRTTVENPVQRVMREGLVVGLGNHTLLIARDAAERPIADSGAPILDESGAVIGVVLVFRDQTEEREAQKALQASEELYRSLFNNMLNGFAYCKMLFEQNQPQDFIYLNVNNSFEQLTGLKNVVGKRVSEVIPGIGESNPELIEIYGRVALTGKPERFETYVEALKMWLSISVYSAEKEYFVAVFDVITERKRAEEALRASEERYRTVADYTYDMEYWINEEGKVLYMSPSCERFTGYAAQAFIDDPHLLNHIVHPEDIELFRRHGKEAYSGTETCNLDFRLIHRNGQELWVNHNCQAVFGIDRRPLGRRASSRDITERKRAEEALRESEERYRVLAENVTDVIWVTDLDMNITFSSPSAELLIGYSFEELHGLRLEQLLTPVSLELVKRTLKEQLPLAEIGQESPSVTLELEHIHKDGSIVCVEAKGSFLRDSHGQLVGILGVSRDLTERKRAEETLRQREMEFRMVVNNIPAVVFKGYLDGAVDFFDDKVTEMTGYSKADFDARRVKWTELMLKEDLRNAARIFIQALRTDRFYVREYRIKNKEGKDIWIQERSHIVGKPGGEVEYLSGVFFDISEPKRAGEVLERLRLQNELILKAAGEGIFGLDRLGNVTFVNPEAARTTGYGADELIGQQIHEKIHYLKPNGTPYSKEDCPIYATLRDGKVRRLTNDVFWTKEGKSFPVDYVSTAIEEKGNITGAVAIFRDITQRQQAEEAFRSLVSHAPMGIFIIQDGKFIMINPGFEAITGYCKEELLGQESKCLATPPYKEVVRGEAIKRLKGESSTPFEFQFITKSGETRWGIETIAPTQFEGKGATLGYFMDVTERKQLEAQFLQAQKMEAVGTLAGGIAHDFNNILTAILGNIGLAVLDDKIGPRVQDRLAQAEAACLRAQALSQQLLTFARGGAPVKKLFSVAELLTESTAFTCVGSPVKCETTFPENLWWIEADPGQIGQVFQNLTINAIQAMPTGGTIKVWAENLTLGTDSDLPLSAGRYIKISVRDQGMGIPAEHLPRIFDPYFTTKHKGSGLGLASAYAIVNKHHGHIAVESKQGVGTTFNIYLPAVERQVTPQPEEDRELLVGKGKILVMDDEEMVREVLGRVLARLGYEAEFARDGGEAIEMFVQAQGSGQAFAAVILDITVPGGMGGKETMARLLEIDPQIKAVVSSGYSDDPIMADFQKYGFSGVIAKPYKISELGKILHEVFMGKP